MKSLRAMAARLLRPLLMVERLPLNTPAMKRPGSPGTCPATCSTCMGSIWSRVRTWAQRWYYHSSFMGTSFMFAAKVLTVFQPTSQSTVLRKIC